jgi:hypothetical protein
MPPCENHIVFVTSPESFPLVWIETKVQEQREYPGPVVTRRDA